MKSIIKLVVIAAVIILYSNSVKAQDKIITNENKTINCDITKINEEAIFFNVNLKGKISSTFINKSQIKDYFIDEIERIKTELDTSSFFHIKLDDATSLLGKIKSIDKSKINFDDNNLGLITIKGETIKEFEKENKDSHYFVIMNDGNELHGKIVERKKEEIVFETNNLGIVTISLKNIREIKEVNKENFVGNQYWFPNPNNTRYLFSPTAINLKKDEGYYQSAYIIMNSANYGLTDNFSIGGGVFLPVAVVLTPKFGFKIAEKFHLGGGAIMGLFPGPITVGILYGVATLGSDENNITGGIGYGFIDEDFTSTPVITFSAMTRIGKRLALVTENWGISFHEYDYNYETGQETKSLKYHMLFSYGFRIMSKKTTFDIAFINNKDIFNVFPLGIPYIDFVYKF
ncbi:MAG: hypothetical protein JXR51_04265 [Bacteroidales bacterium]|nr:hypothetical protein [Bacteroidales bacterium]MBN2756370.1 hypothetical protein [Bacteroidales bacterium]